MQELTELERLIPTHPSRKRVYDKFYNLIKKHIHNIPNYNEDNIQKMAINLERGIFNHTITIYHSKRLNETWNNEFNWLYINRAVKIYINLNPDGPLQNKTLLPKLLNKEINEFDLCSFTSEQLFPERWKELNDKYTTNVINDSPLPIKLEDRPDGILKCGKCKSYKTSYYQLQTRGADESLTTFVTCHQCGNKWKFG